MQTVEKVMQLKGHKVTNCERNLDACLVIPYMRVSCAGTTGNLFVWFD